MSELLDTWRHNFVKAIKDKYAGRYSSDCSHSWDPTATSSLDEEARVQSLFVLVSRGETKEPAGWNGSECAVYPVPPVT